MLRSRIREKQIRNRKEAKRAKRERVNADVQVLIHSFLNGDGGSEEAMQCEVCATDVDTDAEVRSFWNEVCPNPHRTILSHIDSPQRRSMRSRGVKPSRVEQLGCKLMHRG